MAVTKLMLHKDANGLDWALLAFMGLTLIDLKANRPLRISTMKKDVSVYSYPFVF